MSNEETTKAQARPSRHEQRKAATHQALIDACREVIVEKGYNRVEILDITERADVSKATFYQHFPNKEACVRELMQQGFDALVEEILRAHTTAPSQPLWVHNSLARAFNWADENRAFMLIMVGGAASTELNQFGRQYMVEITENTIIDRIRPFTDLRYPPPLQAQIVTGIFIQLLGWWLETDTGYTAGEMADIIQDVLKHGVGTFKDVHPQGHDNDI